MKLLVVAGEKCETLMGRVIVNVPVKDVECDEIWGFIQKKEGHKGPEEAHDETIGDAYCFVAIERHTKLVLNFALGRRSKATTDIFIEGLRQATSSQNFQITTDGFAPYVKAISDTLSDRVSFAQLIKVYRSSTEGEARYSPAEVASVEVVPVIGQPDPRANLHQHRRASEPHDQNEYAETDPAHQWLLEKMGEPVGSLLPALRVLQLLPYPPFLARHPRHGIEAHRSRLGHRGVAGVTPQ